MKDVDSYQKFIPYMSESVVDRSTLQYDAKTKSGSFNADTTIGFNQISLSYTSEVSFKDCEEVISRSEPSSSSSVFQ